MIRAVVDLNIFISALIKPSTANLVNTWREGKFQLVFSESSSANNCALNSLKLCRVLHSGNTLLRLMRTYCLRKLIVSLTSLSLTSRFAYAAIQKIMQSSRQRRAARLSSS